MSKVRDLFDRLEAEDATALAEAERLAKETGKELFDLGTFEQLYGRGSQASAESSHRASYYISHPEIRTLKDYIAFLRRIEPWEDSN